MSSAERAGFGNEDGEDDIPEMDRDLEDSLMRSIGERVGDIARRYKDHGLARIRRKEDNDDHDGGESRYA